MLNYVFMSEDITNFHCKACKKVYSSYPSLWFHINKFHNTYVKENVMDVKVVVKENVKDVNVVKNMCKKSIFMSTI